MKTENVRYRVTDAYLNVIVTDKITKKPIPFVKVTLTECGLTDRTDDRGRTFIHSIPPEIYCVRFDAHGFLSHIQIINFQSGEVREERVALTAI